MIEAIQGVINAISGFCIKAAGVPPFPLRPDFISPVRTDFVRSGPVREFIKVGERKVRKTRNLYPFGALMVSTVLRVGTGTSSGVSTAIRLGGSEPSSDVDNRYPRRSIRVHRVLILPDL